MKHVAVIGLGNFGMGLARALSRLGARVVAVDNQRSHVDAVKDEVHTALCMDATDREALAARGIHETDCAVICMGEDFTAAELSAVHLKELGCRSIVVRGTSDERVAILRALGPQVITPGLNAARQMAVKLLGDGLADHCTLEGDLHVAVARTPPGAEGQVLSSLEIEKRYRVKVLGIRARGAPAEEVVAGPTGQRILEEGDELILLGEEHSLVDLGRAFSRGTGTPRRSPGPGGT